jgi:Mitochondrial ATPase expression
MSSFLFKFEAVPSRIASYSCPPGVPGRVHAIRLRRCFQPQPSRAFAAQESHENIPQADNDPEQACKKAGNGDGILEQAQSPSPELIQKVFYPSSALEGRLRLLAIKTEKRFGVRRRVPGEDADVPGMRFTTHGEKAERWFFSALRRDDPHDVLFMLKRLVRHDGVARTSEFLERMPASTFSELLRCLDPQHFVGRYQELHKGISEKVAAKLRLPPVDERGYYKFCDLFLDQVNGFFSARHRAIPMSLADFRYLLRCARATGNSPVGHEIWENLRQMKEREIVPDLECYNHYLAVLAWADILNPVLRYRLRLVPRNFEPRQWNVPPRPITGHRTGPSGIKYKASEVFREMVQAGVAGNEETFCHMMIAFAREGDLAGVESILKRVWNIDIDALMKSSNSEPPTKNYSEDSPFYPSEQLLYAIAHAYGINNEIPTALRLVDYVSRQYSVPIPRNTWRELLMWTYVLSMKRRPFLIFADGETVENPNVVGQLPPEAISNLWGTMTSEPYNVQPTIDMYNRLIQNLLSRQRFGELQIRIEEARRLYMAEVDKLSQEVQLLYSASLQHKNPTIQKRKRDLEYLLIKSRRNRQYLRNWARMLLKKANHSFRSNYEWQTRGLPKMLKRWRLFIPDVVNYKTISGEVRLWSSTVQEKKLRQQRYQPKPPSQTVGTRVGRRLGDLRAPHDRSISPSTRSRMRQKLQQRSEGGAESVTTGDIHPTEAVRMRQRRERELEIELQILRGKDRVNLRQWIMGEINKTEYHRRALELFGGAQMPRIPGLHPYRRPQRHGELVHRS